MINKAIHLLRDYLAFSENLYNKQKARQKELAGYENMLLDSSCSKSGTRYYCAKKKGDKKFSYLGGEDHPEVRKIKEARYLKKSIPIIEKNNKLIRRLVRGYRTANLQTINDMLPKLYRNTYGLQIESKNEKARKWKEQAEAYKNTFEVPFPENLKVKTIEQTWVRSKSEALIYNILVSLGITFVYELPLKLKHKTEYPDFTILSEIDYETEIIIEHLGMMSVESYRSRNFKKIMDYMREGYLQGINIFYTFEYTDGGVDLTPVLDIISLKVRPMTNSSAA
ncbi:MAG: hypothetical protein IKE85_02755 [Mogibacterium sp.]|nr:hypothetical protein [Mogibacterium sp.]MBR2539736.1 hypothetical protein [Mogibacterium sp.]